MLAVTGLGDNPYTLAPAINLATGLPEGQVPVVATVAPTTSFLPDWMPAWVPYFAVGTLAVIWFMKKS